MKDKKILQDGLYYAKISYICALCKAFSFLNESQVQDILIAVIMKSSNLFSEKEIEVWKKDGLEGLCELYNIDEEVEETLMCFLHSESANILKVEK
jgi:hypothetical protein